MTVGNKQLVLIAGESSTGKSASLRNIRNQSEWLYLNCEAKEIPFKNDFFCEVVTHPTTVYEGVSADGPNGIIIDSLTFLMDMFESINIVNAPKAKGFSVWSDYSQYFKVLMQDKIAKVNKPVIMIAHNKSVLNEAMGAYETSVPLKASIKDKGVESYFTTVVYTKKMPLHKLEPYKSELLNITEDDELLGYKYVFQTRLTKETLGDRIRSPLGAFTKEQTFMDNDAQLLLDHLTNFYK